MTSCHWLNRCLAVLWIGVAWWVHANEAKAAPPTAIQLSPAVGYEWCPPLTSVGVLTAVDPDPGDTHTFTLVSGAGSTHNFGVLISGNKLLMRYGFERDFEVWGTILLYCRVRATDSTGAWVETPLVVTMLDDREEDFDGDGLTEAAEEDLHGTSDLIFDHDGDGVGDGAEVAQGTSPTNPAQWPSTAIIGWGDSSLKSRAAPIGSGFIGLSTGQHHSLTLKTDGGVQAWGGLGSYGQLTVPTGLTDVVDVSAGGDFWQPDTAHSLALKRDGTLVAWGCTHDGTLVLPAGLTDVVAISAGRSHCLALKQNGTVVAWGNNPHGTVQPPEGLSNVVAISAGGFHSLALKQDGSVVSWGSRFLGGEGQHWVPASVPVGLTDVVAISAGRFHSLALRKDGTVAAWGYNLDGQINVPAGLDDVVAVAAGGFHSMALKSDGSVVMWGSNSHGQCQAPASAQSGVKLISAGIFHSLAVSHGPGYPAITSPAEILSSPGLPLSHQVTVTSGVLPEPLGAFSAIGLPAELAIDPDTGVISGTPSAPYRGSFVLHVETDQGLLSQNAWIGISQGSPPTAISLSANTVPENSPAGFAVATLAASDPDLGDTHTYEWLDGPGGSDNGLFRIEGNMLLVDKTLTRDFEQSSQPFSIRLRVRDASLNAFEQQFVLNLTDDRVEDADGDGLSEQAEEDFFLTSDTMYDSDGDGFGDGFELFMGGLAHDASIFPADPLVVVWGDRTNGQLDFPGDLENVVSLAAGHTHCLAVMSNRRVTAWGTDHYGETIVPENLEGVIAADAGSFHSVALIEDGTVVAWGNNDAGQTNVPAGLVDVVSIAAGGFHTLALKSDGTVVAWGDDSEGQSTVPAGLANVVAVAGGGFHSLALKSDGTVVAWGSTWQGVTAVPPDLTGVVDISAGGYHSLALKQDGTVVAWGSDMQGQSNVPVGLSGVSKLSAGWLHSLALRHDGSVVAWGENGNGQTAVPLEAQNIRFLDAGSSFNLSLRQASGFPAFADPSSVKSWPGETASRLMEVGPVQQATYQAMGLPAGLSISPASGLVSGMVATGERRAVRITADTDAGVFSRVVWFNTADGLPPTGILLSGNSIPENSPANTVVGTLSAVDPNSGDTATVDLTYVPEGPDSFRFKVVNGQLLTRYPLAGDFDSGKTQLTIRAVAVDTAGNRFEQNLTLLVLDDRMEDADVDGVPEWEEEDVFGSSDAAFTNFATFDSDLDGMPGMIEHAFNLPPLSAGRPQRLIMGAGSTAGLPATALVTSVPGTQRLRLEYIRRVGAGLTYVPQFTSDVAGTWQAATNPVTVTPIAAGWERCVVDDSQTTSAASKRFARVAVSW
jgi:alpha-tubulin suppressor-like RCC1 family protein